MALERIRTQQRIVSKSVNTIRSLFSDNGIKLNEFSIQNNLKVVGYSIPIKEYPPLKLKEVLDKNANHLVTFNSEVTYVKYEYKTFEVTLSFFEEQTSIFIK